VVPVCIDRVQGAWPAPGTVVVENGDGTDPAQAGSSGRRGGGVVGVRSYMRRSSGLYRGEKACGGGVDRMPVALMPAPCGRLVGSRALPCVAVGQAGGGRARRWRAAVHERGERERVRDNYRERQGVAAGAGLGAGGLGAGVCGAGGVTAARRGHQHWVEPDIDGGASLTCDACSRPIFSWRVARSTARATWWCRSTVAWPVTRRSGSVVLTGDI
jgi:hypothetical protein